MGAGEAIADIDRHGAELAERLLGTIDPIHGGFRGGEGPHAAAHQFLWRHYIVTGSPAYSEAVVASLQATCRRAEGAGAEGFRDGAGAPSGGKTLGEDAQMLELLTWVWRHCRDPELRARAEGIATWTTTRMRRTGFGFAADSSGADPDDTMRADSTGLMLVALIEAGSVFERRDWLAMAREVFDEVVAAMKESAADDEHRGAWHLDDYVMMGRAAIRLFEAFGKRRYVEHARAWVAKLDEAFWEPGHGCYRACVTGASRPASILDAAMPSGAALMIGVLGRLHALTDEPPYAERAGALVEAYCTIIKRSGLAAATAVAGVQTLARPVFIKVSGDPKLETTRELMRVALDCALPDRLVLGPGAGDPDDGSPKVLIRLGTHEVAPITDAAHLRAFLAPGGFTT